MALAHFFGRPQNILMACTGDQIERYLMPAVRGERMDALAMTEPGAGSDIRSMTCAAQRDGGDWVVNGTKHFISGADHADFIIVFVATGQDQTPRGPKKRITAFLVDRGTPGFTIRDGYRSVSHRGYNNMVLEFDDCRLADAQVLGQVDGGLKVMNTWLYATRITVATNCVGRARRVFDMALNYAAEREQFGQAIGKFQGVSFQLADMITEIDAADLMTLAAADRLDQGLPANREIASAKLFASEMLARVTDAAIPGARRHGPDGRPAAGTVLARRAGRTHLGRHLGNPAPHHQPRAVAPAWGLTHGNRPRQAVSPKLDRGHRRWGLGSQYHSQLPENRVSGRSLAGASDPGRT